MHHSSFTYTPESKEIAIQKLDDEIRELSERLRLLKSQRNSFTVTYTLPTEIMGEVFAIVRTDRNQYWHKSFDHLKDWLRVTHVSQHWRKVALEASHLWCYIDQLPPAAIKEFLVRSGRRNLFVEIYRSVLYPGDVLDLIFGQLPRIQRLTVRSSRRFHEVLQYIKSTPAPNMEEIVISTRPDAWTRGDNIAFPRDREIFQGITPRLRRLSLSRCNISSTSPLFMNDLTILEIDDCPAGSSADWLTIIQRMPRLSCLRLESSFTDQTQAEIENYAPIATDFPIIPLLQLSLLEIRGGWLAADLDFLAHLTFSSRTYLIFSSEVNRNLRHDRELTSTPFISFLRIHNQCRHDMLPDMEITNILWDEHKSPFISLDLTTIHFTAAAGVTRGYFNAYISCLNRSDYGEEDIAELSTLPISTATSLTIEGDIGPWIWEALSRQLPNIQEISCWGRGVEPTLLALGALETDCQEPVRTPDPWEMDAHYNDPFQFEMEQDEGDIDDNDEGDTHDNYPFPFEMEQYEETIDVNGEEEEDLALEVEIDEEIVDGTADPQAAFPADSTPNLYSDDLPTSPFKSLKTLHLTHESISSKVEAALVSVLNARRNQDLPIQTIKFSDCTGITEESHFVTRLKELVDEVVCHECKPEEPQREAHDYDHDDQHGLGGYLSP